METSELSEMQFAALQALVNCARHEGVSSLKRLRQRVVDKGFTETDVDAAIKLWSATVVGTRACDRA